MRKMVYKFLDEYLGNEFYGKTIGKETYIYSKKITKTKRRPEGEHPAMAHTASFSKKYVTRKVFLKLLVYDTELLTLKTMVGPSGKWGGQALTISQVGSTMWGSQISSIGPIKACGGQAVGPI